MSQLDLNVGLAVEVLEAVDREIASLLPLTRHSSPEKAAFFVQKLAAKRAEREQLRARFVAAAQLVQQRTDHRAGLPERNDRE
jgi:hypothetical protein